MDTQYKDLRAALVGQGDLELCPEYKKYEVKIDVWAKLPQEKRDRHFKRFMSQTSLVDTRTVFTTNGQKVYKGPGKNGGKKPHQRKRRRNAKTTSFPKKK